MVATDPWPKAASPMIFEDKSCEAVQLGDTIEDYNGCVELSNNTGDTATTLPAASLPRQPPTPPHPDFTDFLAQYPDFTMACMLPQRGAQHWRMPRLISCPTPRRSVRHAPHTRNPPYTAVVRRRDG